MKPVPPPLRIVQVTWWRRRSPCSKAPSTPWSSRPSLWVHPRLRDHQLEERRLLEAAWGTTENNRRARYFTLTPAGLALVGVYGVVAQVAPMDPVLFVGVPVLVLITALLASWLPAARARRADPCEVLRGE